MPEVINSPPLPKHVAFIMDGNGRWAKERGLKRLEGHKKGAVSVRKVIEESRRLGIRYVTLYSFSTENWRRSTEEVSGLMELFSQYLDSELPELLKNGVRLRAIGDLARLPLAVRTALRRDIEKTAKNTDLDLVLAVSYGSREEIVAAVKSLAREVKAGSCDVEDIDEEAFSNALWTADMPDPDLLIRTSGELRISNFLLWQLAYTEIVVVPEFWPDFDEEVYRRCLDQYQSRERRFGKTGDQINGEGTTPSSTE